MTCASCVARVEKKLNKLDGVSAVVNLATERAHIELDPSAAALSNEELIAVVVKAGYDAALIRRHDAVGSPNVLGAGSRSGAGSRAGRESGVGSGSGGGAGSSAPSGGSSAPSGGSSAPGSGNSAPAGSGSGGGPESGEFSGAEPLATSDPHTADEAERAQAERAQAAQDAADAAAKARVADLWRRFKVSAVLSVPVIGLSMFPALQFAGWQWLIAVLSLFIAFWCGWPFHRAAFRAARYGASTMDTLVSLGVIASMGWSLWALMFGGAGGMDYTMHMTGIHGLGHTASPHIYFESAAMIVTFLLVGRWLEARSRHHAGDALRALLELGASEALLVSRADATLSASTPASPAGPSDGRPVTLSDADPITPEATMRMIPASDLRVGDIFRVRPGEKVAADGVVVSGTSSIDASLVTGESVPVDVGPGDPVTGATLNVHGSLDIRATRVGEETTLAQMGRLLAEAQTGKAPVQRIADRISAVFVPGVIAIALATFAVRLAIGNPLQMALASAITVLVVACPCALGLATPTALLVGSGRLSRLGALIRGPEVLESAHRVDTIMLDKTGTLTTGIMSVNAVEPAPDSGLDATALLALAAGLEGHSEHPVAKAIVRAAREEGITPAVVSEFENHSGRGVSGRVNSSALAAGGSTAGSSFAGGSAAGDIGSGSNASTLIAAGRLDWLANRLPLDADHLRSGVGTLRARVGALEETGATVVVIAVNDAVAGLIAVRDTLRPEAAETIAALRAGGLTAVVVTGDNAGAAATVADELGIEDVRAGVLPDQKLQILRELQGAGRRVAMVGDGVNDAAVLAGADLSIAMGSGTDVAKAAADITIVNSDIRAIPASLHVSGRTLTIIKENLAWAFSYNLVAIPLAVFGLIVPGIAAFAMASSSVIVVANSLRLRAA
ncbi:copper-translocating P-type ATPase [Trueperella pecoris]|uniref:Copper-translocating P-type ATPase n=1 Tax=Trueperella pecoris TaxID=2733571 RepID=A0A7M1R568_9ACTO|nr:copper-translocating P-type ATPase [Trueperella pecoris]